MNKVVRVKRTEFIAVDYTVDDSAVVTQFLEQVVRSVRLDLVNLDWYDGMAHFQQGSIAMPDSIRARWRSSTVNLRGLDPDAPEGEWVLRYAPYSNSAGVSVGNGHATE
ncbi:hypothetical protein L1785_03345 [Antribacter sp. KLBMP9083]|uniref:Uncharacterized protein n=1 Tax=Antribacter soli TaxID=2910976 RepID=A0AA41QBZ9_9MICO|nr:hypothetical protein [Antribacter soli]MCF4120005.1 hypothetical protein [Antribacter soli]